MKKVTLIIDLQFGSTGKGLIAGYLAERDGPDTVINANMPNAGHTYINDAGRVWMHKVLPNGIVSPGLERVMIGPQSVFDPKQFAKEVQDSADLLKHKSIYIHRDAVLLDQSHRATEQSTLSGISSTMQGSAAAIISKMNRRRNEDHRAGSSASFLRYVEYLQDEYNIDAQVVDNSTWTMILRRSEKILAEGAQGFSLGLNAGFWPYCTSRDCTPTRFMADMGIPWNMLDTVVGTARVHPIRVGSTPDGYSGDVYEDQEELSWGALGVSPELTTVTKRERRVFTFSHVQMLEAIAACAPTEIFLNFCNYDAEKARQITGAYSSLIKYLGYGAKRNQVVEVGVDVEAIEDIING